MSGFVVFGNGGFIAQYRSLGRWAPFGALRPAPGVAGRCVSNVVGENSFNPVSFLGVLKWTLRILQGLLTSDR